MQTTVDDKPRAPSQEEWQQEAAIATLDLAQMDALILKSVELWDDHAAKKEVESAARVLAEEHDAKITEALKNAGKSSYKLDGVGTAYLSTKSVVRVPNSIEGKKKFFSYLKSIGEDVFLGMATVNSQTLNSWFSTKMEENAEKSKATGIGIAFEVPGIEAPTMRETLGFRADKKGKR